MSFARLTMAIAQWLLHHLQILQHLSTCEENLLKTNQVGRAFLEI